MKDLQKKVDALIMEFGGYWSPFKMLAALMEEIGELSNEILAVEGVKGNGSEESLREEIGDVLFALTCIANYYGIDLSKALESTITKYKERDTPRWIK